MSGALKVILFLIAGQYPTIRQFQKYTKDAAEAAALAVKAGTDLECGVDYKQLMAAIERGLLKESILMLQ